MQAPALHRHIGMTGPLIVGNTPAESAAQIPHPFQVYQDVVGKQYLKLA